MITFERITAVLFAACLVLLPLPGAGKAGCRAVVHHRNQQQAAVVFQPVYQQPYWYSVGQNYQIAAIVQETLKAQQLLAAQPQQLTAPPCPDGTCQTPQPQTLPLTAEPDRWALTKEFCSGCHTTKEAAMLAIHMEDFAALSCEQRINAVKNMVDGAMPPKNAKQPTPEQLGNLIGEWVGAETVGK